jgi:hypothetical protein
MARVSKTLIHIGALERPKLSKGRSALPTKGGLAGALILSTRASIEIGIEINTDGTREGARSWVKLKTLVDVFTIRRVLETILADAGFVLTVGSFVAHPGTTECSSREISAPLAEARTSSRGGKSTEKEKKAGVSNFHGSKKI